MRLIQITLHNIQRRKARSLLLFISILVGVATVVFLYASTQAMKKDISNKLDLYGSNILILPESSEALTFGGITFETPRQEQELNDSLLPLMKTIKNQETLSVISPKLLASLTVNGEKVLLVGVDFHQELVLKKWWKIDGLPWNQFPSTSEIIIGSDVAQSLKLKPQQILDLQGQDFSVAGVIRQTGSPENDQAIFMDLTTLQNLINKPHVISLIEAAALCYTCPIDEVTKQLREKLPGTTVTALRSSVQSRDNTVQRFSLFALSVSALIFLTSSLIVFLAMKSSVEDRIHELGLWRAIGYRKRHILQIILTEAALQSISGSLIGSLLGMGLATQWGGRLLKIQVPIAWQTPLVIMAIASAVILGICASLYPALKATRVNPSEALRHI